MPLQRSDLPGLQSGANTLMELLGGNQNKLQQMKAAHEMGQTAIKQNVQTAQDLANQNPGMGVNIGEGGNVGLSKPMNIGNLDFRREKNIQDKTEHLSKRQENINGFSSALQDIEDKTNREGRGGVVSSPHAKLISTGKVLSNIPTAYLGTAELLGAAPKGSADERKSLERLVLEYQKAMSGTRQTDELRKAERSALGWVTSSDPDLVSKGVRTLARNIKNRKETIEAGYDPEVVNRYQKQGGSAQDFLNQIYDDSPQANKTSDAAPSADPMSQKKARYEELMRKKMGR